MSLHSTLQRWWYQRGPSPALLLAPLAWVYGLIMALRRVAYRHGWLKSYRAPVPVVVVGNFTAGGTGKTPAVIALVEALRESGYKPGVVSRGYGRKTKRNLLITAQSTAAQVGDEPLLIARLTGAPVAVAARRADAVRLLLAQPQACDLIVADDGLQHLALQRDIEIVLQGVHREGNGWLLPAGPLRERPRPVDAVLVSAGTLRAGEWPLTQQLGDTYAAADPSQRRALASFTGQACAAVAGIAHPDTFFEALRAAGVKLGRCVALPDHDDYQHAPFAALRESVIFVTEKDAIKCTGMDPRLWVVPLQTQLPQGLIDLVLQRLPQP